MNDDHAGAMVLASLIGDSLALGVHWIYDVASLLREHGRVESYVQPGAKSYHPTKKAGDFTHYGDQAMVLLESLAAKGVFDPLDFFERWRGFFTDYQGYFDGATKMTLKNYGAGRGALEAGSSSNDLAGAARMAPLIYYGLKDEDQLAGQARTQTALTHKDPDLLAAAEFLARVCFSVLNGLGPVKAMERVSREYFDGSKIASWVEAGLSSAGENTLAVINRFGQSCHTPQALPGVVHLIAKYQDDLKTALVEAVMAGGDNAARAMAVGMVLGAWQGPKAIPEEWSAGLNGRRKILAGLEKRGW